MPKITKRTINALMAPERGESKVWDSELRGFGLRIRASGHRAFIIQYRNGEGRTRRLTIGRLGQLTPEEARKQARQLLAAVARGEDPAEERAKARRAETVAELAARFLTEHAEAKRKPSTAREYRRIFERIILPRLGHRKIASLTAADVATLHHSMRDRPSMANRTVATLSAMLTKAEVWGARPRGSNPCRFVEKFPEQPRERFLSSAELARLGEVLRTVEEENSEHCSVVPAIRLLLLTGCRVGEVLSLKWDYVDFDRRCLALPDSKTGKKVIPVGTAALELLASIARMEGNQYVFFGAKRGSHLVDLQHPWERIRRRVGLEDVRLHDLRHSYASFGAGAGLSLPIIGKILGHRHPATTNRYAHLADHPVQTGADLISDGIRAALEAEPTGPVTEKQSAQPRVN